MGLEVDAAFGRAFAGRRVLVTGHTGFKGAWLSHWLLKLGAEVSGIGLAPDTTPSLAELLGLAERLDHHEIDIRDHARLCQALADLRPELVLHLAAQPLVRASYADPKTTWDTNVGGTVNLLEAVRACPSVRACVVISSDKCYENREWVWGYRESDPMGGHDPYSASKGAVELVVASYRRSFFADPDGCQLASARAGNVIGGGDWASDRIVTDLVKAVAAGRSLELRNPRAVRPWQHVLEPVSGYLHLAQRLLQADGSDFASAWNFGPADAAVIDVEGLARRLVKTWGAGEVVIAGSANQPHEAGLLKLDVSKARALLGWHGVWNVDATIRATVEWYRAHHDGNDVRCLTDDQISNYFQTAADQGVAWASERAG